jgi:hypothetical protein
VFQDIEGTDRPERVVFVGKWLGEVGDVGYEARCASLFHRNRGQVDHPKLSQASTPKHAKEQPIAAPHVDHRFQPNERRARLMTPRDDLIASGPATVLELLDLIGLAHARPRSRS